jgi:hypothetical protein
MNFFLVNLSKYPNCEPMTCELLGSSILKNLNRVKRKDNRRKKKIILCLEIVND